MELNWQVVRERYEGVIEGRLTLADADNWARTVLRGEDAGNLEFIPNSDEAQLWEAAKFLFGIDTETAPGVALHAVEQIKKMYEQNWKSVCSKA